MSGININYLTQANNNMIQCPKANSITKEDTTFSDKITKNRKDNVNSLTETAGSKSVDEMTLEEYKVYILDKISNIPISASQSTASFSVTISEAGYEAMKKDPEYEKWVLDGLEYDFGFNDPWSSSCGGRYSMHYFGATKEEYHGESWGKGYDNGKGQELYDEKAINSSWEKRTKRKKQLNEQYEKAQERMRLQKDYYEDKIQKKNMAYDKLQQQLIENELIDNGDKSLTQPINAAVIKAATAYESNIMSVTPLDNIK